MYAFHGLGHWTLLPPSIRRHFFAKVQFQDRISPCTDEIVEKDSRHFFSPFTVMESYPVKKSTIELFPRAVALLMETAQEQ